MSGVHRTSPCGENGDGGEVASTENSEWDTEIWPNAGERNCRMSGLMVWSRGIARGKEISDSSDLVGDGREQGDKF